MDTTNTNLRILKIIFCKECMDVIKQLPQQMNGNTFFDPGIPIYSDENGVVDSHVYAGVYETSDGNWHNIPWMDPLPDYGDLMTLDDFVISVTDGDFINYDGNGYYATETQKSRKPAVPSVIKAGRIDRTFTHVMWFNR